MRSAMRRLADVTESLADRVRARLRDEMHQRKLSQPDVGSLIQWTQSKVAQKLNARSHITLDELESLCFAVGIPPSEAVRDRGLEFCAEMAPHELRMLEQFRQQTQDLRDLILKVLKVTKSGHLPDRHAGSLKKQKPKKSSKVRNDDDKSGIKIAE